MRSVEDQHWLHSQWSRVNGTHQAQSEEGGGIRPGNEEHVDSKIVAEIGFPVPETDTRRKRTDVVIDPDC